MYGMGGINLLKLVVCVQFFLASWWLRACFNRATERLFDTVAVRQVWTASKTSSSFLLSLVHRRVHCQNNKRSAYQPTMLVRVPFLWDTLCTEMMTSLSNAEGNWLNSLDWGLRKWGYNVWTNLFLLTVEGCQVCTATDIETSQQYEIHYCHEAFWCLSEYNKRAGAMVPWKPSHSLWLL